MSGPIRAATGTADGVAWTVPADLSNPMVVPSMGQETTPVPGYYDGPLPYRGDFQRYPQEGERLVIEFDKPIKQFRTTAKGIRDGGMAMYAVIDRSHMTGIGGFVFTAAASTAWGANTQGTRTVTYEPGFTILILKPLVFVPTDGSYILSARFLNTFFFEEIQAAETIPDEPSVIPSAGSGRTLSLHWPIMNSTNSDPPNANGRIRTQVEGFGGFLANHDSGAQSGNGQVYYQGMRAVRITASSTHNRYFSPPAGTARPFHIFIGTEQPTKAVIGVADEIAWWHLEAVIAYANPEGPIPNDVGLTLCPGLGVDVRGTAQAAGVQFGLRDDQKIGLTVRSVTGEAVTYERLYDLPETFDVTAWNTYKLVLGSADFGVDAVLKVVLNDVVIDTLNWGAGTILPPPFEGTSHGYYWSIGNHGGGDGFSNIMYIAQDSVALVAAATERGLE